MFVHEFPFLVVINHHVEKRSGFRFGHVNNDVRHEPIDIDGFTSGVLIGPEYWMIARAKCFGSLASPLYCRSIIVMVNCNPAVEFTADRRVQSVVGGVPP